jgi:hypothetical protein
MKPSYLFIDNSVLGVKCLIGKFVQVGLNPNRFAFSQIPHRFLNIYVPIKTLK